MYIYTYIAVTPSRLLCHRYRFLSPISATLGYFFKNAYVSLSTLTIPVPNLIKISLVA